MRPENRHGRDASGVVFSENIWTYRRPMVRWSLCHATGLFTIWRSTPSSADSVYAGRPLFEIEQIAEKLIDRVLFKQPQSERTAEMPFEQRGRLFKIGQHPRGVGVVFLGLAREGRCLRRLQRQAPMQIDAAEARRLFQKCQPVIDENLRDRIGVLRFPAADRSPT